MLSTPTPLEGVEIFCFDHLERKMDWMEEVGVGVVVGGAPILGLNGIHSNGKKGNIRSTTRTDTTVLDNRRLDLFTSIRMGCVKKNK